MRTQDSFRIIGHSMILLNIWKLYECSSPTPGIDSILALLKSEYGGDVFDVDNLDWTNPQGAYLKAILPES